MDEMRKYLENSYSAATNRNHPSSVQMKPSLAETATSIISSMMKIEALLVVYLITHSALFFSTRNFSNFSSCNTVYCTQIAIRSTANHVVMIGVTIAPEFRFCWAIIAMLSIKMSRIIYRIISVRPRPTPPAQSIGRAIRYRSLISNYQGTG